MPATILAIGFTLGVALMGVEMTAMRMMTPFFGSSIDIWACMISTVMLSLMAGYYIGGQVADRAPRTSVLGTVVIGSGLFLSVISFPKVWEQTVDTGSMQPPWLANLLLDWMSLQFGAGDQMTLVTGALLSAILLMFLPMTLLSFFSPYAVRLLLTDPHNGGRVAGSVYSITTVGNVVGTLGTALGLMRVFGAAQIMLGFSLLIVVCGIALVAIKTKARADA